MKQTPLKRKTALRKKSAVRAVPPKPKKPKRKTKYARRERDLDYMRWVKLQTCLLAGKPGAGPCGGVVEADHAGLDRGIGQKAPDNTCIPLCTHHHRDRHAATGFFRHLSKEAKRAWRLEAIRRTQLDHAEQNETLPFPGLVF